MQDLRAIVEGFSKVRLLVVGDMIADLYLDCSIDRISREAPVLVLEEEAERVVAGGAANVVHNVATLGGRATSSGVIGNDSAGSGLADILSAKGAVTSGMLRAGGLGTISKTRVIAGGRTTVSQQIVRIDRNWQEALPDSVEAELLAYLGKAIGEVDGVIISDYGIGTITPSVRKFLLTEGRRLGVPIMVDSRYNILEYQGVNFVKQNDAEAGAAVGFELMEAEDRLLAGRELLRLLDADCVMITLGADGLMLFLKNGEVHSIPVEDKSEVFDVSGAGDTAVAAFMLAVLSGAEPKAAGRLSNLASGIAVRKLGTATVGQQELLALL